MSTSLNKQVSSFVTVGLVFFLLFFVNYALVFPLFASPADSVTISSYPLPFPGILPDHPLYFLKVTRDKIYDSLVRDPVKKSEFRLTTADKRLYMGIMLWDNGKKELAESTISKASKYFELSFLAYLKAKKEGRDVSSLADKIRLSSYKHLEILNGLTSGADESLIPGLSESYQRVFHYQQELEQPTEMEN